MEDLKQQFQKETNLSFDGIPINGVHLEYINWLEKRIEALSIANVVGTLPIFTKEQVYRIVANFALSVNTESFCGGYGTTTQIVEELKKYDYVDFSGTEKGQ